MTRHYSSAIDRIAITVPPRFGKVAALKGRACPIVVPARPKSSGGLLTKGASTRLGAWLVEALPHLTGGAM